MAKYNALGGPGGFLGLPTSDELTNPDGVGKRTSFEGNSSIYWHPSTGAHQIGGEIGAKWGELGWEGGALGYPTTDEDTNPDGVGKRNWFQNGAIYWHPSTKAWPVWGKILERWRDEGYETGRYGYPTGPETAIWGGFKQPFVGGDLYWGLDAPNCQLRIDNAHGSFHVPGTTNLVGGVPNASGYRCDRPVKSLGVELKLMAESDDPNHRWQLVDWTDIGTKHDATYNIGNISWPDCKPEMVAYGLGRGAIIDYDGVSYPLPAVEGAHSLISNCEGRPN